MPRDLRLFSRETCSGVYFSRKRFRLQSIARSRACASAGSTRRGRQTSPATPCPEWAMEGTKNTENTKTLGFQIRVHRVARGLGKDRVRRIKPQRIITPPATPPPG